MKYGISAPENGFAKLRFVPIHQTIRRHCARKSLTFPT